VTKPVKRAGNKSRKPLDNWIRPELKRLYGKAYSKKGVDLNSDGKLQANEKIATFNNNNIPGYKKNQKKSYKNVIGDWTDWLAFYRANYKAITTKAGKNQSSIFHWTAKFKSMNRIHIVTAVESALVKRKKVLDGYKKLWKLLSLSRRLKMKDNHPFGRLLAIEEAMRRSGIIFKNQDDSLFLNNLSNNQLDCDSGSFVFLTEADEQGWPLYLVEAPRHAFVRWDNNKNGRDSIKFNYGIGSEKSDKQYKREISHKALKQKVYLDNLDQKGFVSFVLHNRAIKLCHKNKDDEAIEDYSRAIELRPNFFGAYYNRNVAYSKLGKYDKAFKDYSQALSLDPKSVAYYNRGSFKLSTTLTRAKPKPSSIWVKLSPELHLDSQVRFIPHRNGPVDSRTTLSFAVNPLQFGSFGLGASLELGYGVGAKHHMFDLLGLVTLERGFHSSSLRFEAGAGYNFLISGKDDDAPISKGGIFKYGLRYTHMFGQFGLSAFVYAQHQFDNPGQPAILTGLGFVWDMRGVVAQ